MAKQNSWRSSGIFAWENTTTCDLGVKGARTPLSEMVRVLKAPVTNTGSRRVSIKQQRGASGCGSVRELSHHRLFVWIENPLKNLNYFLALNSRPLCKALYNLSDSAIAASGVSGLSHHRSADRRWRSPGRWLLLTHHHRTHRFSVLTGGKILVPAVFGLSGAPRTLVVL